MKFKRRLGIFSLCVLLAPLARADEPAAAEAPPTAPAKPKPQVVEVPLSTLDSYVGRYKLKPDAHPGGGTLTLFRDRGHLLVQFTEDRDLRTVSSFPRSILLETIASGIHHRKGWRGTRHRNDVCA